MTTAPVEALFDAIRSGEAELVRELLDEDRTLAGERDDGGVSALRAAKYAGREDLADVVLAADPPLDQFDAAA